MEKKWKTINPILKSFIISIIAACVSGNILSYNTILSYGYSKIDLIIMISIGMFYIVIIEYFYRFAEQLRVYILGIINDCELVYFKLGSTVYLKTEHGFVKKKSPCWSAAMQCVVKPELLEDEQSYYERDFFDINLGIVFTIGVEIILCLIFYVIGDLFFVAVLVSVVNILVNIIVNIIKFLKYRFFKKSFMKMFKIEIRKIEYRQFMIYDYRINGKRLRDIPEKLFEPPVNGDKDNLLYIHTMIDRYNYLMDIGKFHEAKEICEYLLDNEKKLQMVLKMGIKCDLLYIMILEGKSKREIDVHCKGKFINYIYNSRYNLSICRFRYAYAKLLSSNVKEMDDAKKKFDKYCENYLYQGDIESEQQFMKMVDLEYDKRQNLKIIEEAV